MSYTIIFKRIVPLIKRLTGIDDISLWRKRWNKRIGKILYHQKYTARELVGVMQEMGMKQGSTVCIHASMMQFYNYKGTATELIDEILSVLGPEGTLMMPSFSVDPSNFTDDYIFDPKEDKTRAGYLAETFRKYPGVMRSNNARHSACAIGKNAEYLLKDHTTGHDCWDKNSPWYRVCELNGLVFNLGMPRLYIGTFSHCVESILSGEHPYWEQFFNIKRTFKYILNDELKSYEQYDSHILRKSWKERVFKYFDENDWQIRQISNLEIKVFYSNHTLAKLLKLGRKGISCYYIPSTKGYNF